MTDSNDIETVRRGAMRLAGFDHGELSRELAEVAHRLAAPANKVVANPDGITLTVDTVLNALQARQLASALLLAAMSIEKETGALGVLWPREEVNATIARFWKEQEMSLPPAAPEGGTN